MTASGWTDATWDSIRARLRERGLRWTPQRRALIEVLAQTDGHITGSELVERCRRADPQTIPSTVYRTLDVLEDLGVLQHCHGADGREEFHVLPDEVHGHLYCTACGDTSEIAADDARSFLASLERTRGFTADLSHLTVAGRCAGCASEPAPASESDRALETTERVSA